jgi:hypothetical protein
MPIFVIYLATVYKGTGRLGATMSRRAAISSIEIFL